MCIMACRRTGNVDVSPVTYLESGHVPWCVTGDRPQSWPSGHVPARNMQTRVFLHFVAHTAASPCGEQTCTLGLCCVLAGRLLGTGHSNSLPSKRPARTQQAARPHRGHPLCVHGCLVTWCGTTCTPKGCLLDGPAVSPCAQLCSVTKLFNRRRPRAHTLISQSVSQSAQLVLGVSISNGTECVA